MQKKRKTTTTGPSSDQCCSQPPGAEQKSPVFVWIYLRCDWCSAPSSCRDCSSDGGGSGGRGGARWRCLRVLSILLLCSSLQRSGETLWRSELKTVRIKGSFDPPGEPEGSTWSHQFDLIPGKNPELHKVPKTKAEQHNLPAAFKSTNLKILSLLTLRWSKIWVFIC